MRYPSECSGVPRGLWLLLIVGLIVGAPAGATATLVFTPLDVPGERFIQASGINDAGQMVGIFEDATGGHGFLATVPEPGTLGLVTLGLVTLAVRTRAGRRRRD